MACGMAEQCGEPVIISCTGATSAREYMPGPTEAFYRKLPVLAITSTQDISGKVDEVSFENGEGLISINGMTYPISNIKSIRP